MDLATDWDLGDEKQWNVAKQKILSDTPWLLVTSPPCSAFSSLNWGLNYPKMEKKDVEASLEKGRLHLRRSMEAIQMQITGKRYYLHEHPWSASSWQEPEVQKILEHRDNILIRADMCQFNLRVAKGPNGPSARSPAGS